MLKRAPFAISSTRCLATGATAAAMVLAACGGGGSGGSESATTEPGATTPPATEAPTAETTPPETTPPTTASPTTTAPPETAPPITEPAGPDIELFCEASKNVWVPIGSLADLDSGDFGALSVAFEDVNALVPVAIDAAPDAEFAAPAVRMQEILGELIPSFREVGYNLDLVSDLANVDRFDELLPEFDSIADGLKSFLETDCGNDTAALDGVAADYADLIAGSPAPQPTGGSGDAPAGVISTTDDTGRIRLSVPADWAQTDGTPDGETASIVVSSDTAAFLGGFMTPGVFIETAATNDGDNDFRAVHKNTLDSFIESGCSDLGSVDYGDGVFTGTESALDCAPGTTTIVISGTNAQQDLVFNMGLLLEDGDTVTRELIVATFLVSNQPLPADTQPAPEPEPAPDGDDGDGFTTVNLDGIGISFDIPDAWDDVSSQANDDASVVQVSASTDLAAFDSGFVTPGLSLTLTASDNGDAEYRMKSGELMEQLTAAGCESGVANISQGDTLRSIDLMMTCAPGFETHVFTAAAGSDFSTVIVAIMSTSADDTETWERFRTTLLSA